MFRDDVKDEYYDSAAWMEPEDLDLICIISIVSVRVCANLGERLDENRSAAILRRCMDDTA